MSRDHSETCAKCGDQRGGMNSYTCDCDGVVTERDHSEPNLDALCVCGHALRSHLAALDKFCCWLCDNGEFCGCKQFTHRDAATERDQGDEHSEARRVPSMDETLKRAYGVLHALAIGDSSPRTFKRISIVTDSPQYEFCEWCQKHIGRHYGNAETATQEWPAYRCDPKPDVAEPVVSPDTVPRADYDALLVELANVREAGIKTLLALSEACGERDALLAALRECVVDCIERGHEFSKHAYQAATRRLREVAGL